MSIHPNTETDAADNRVVTLQTMTLFMRDDGILHGVALPDQVQTLENARENFACARKLANRKRVPMLMDIRESGTLSHDARLFYAGPEGLRVVTAVGFVADSTFSRVVGNIFIRLANTNYPVRLFATPENAIDWLREQR